MLTEGYRRGVYRSSDTLAVGHEEAFIWIATQSFERRYLRAQRPSNASLFQRISCGKANGRTSSLIFARDLAQLTFQGRRMSHADDLLNVWPRRS
jgi:hypothetical protein